jgi:allantoin racemase
LKRKEEGPVKIIDIPPYRGINFTPEKGHYAVSEIVENMRQRSQLEGVEIDIDDGPDELTTTKKRDEEFLAIGTVGFLERVRAASESGKYDAIVTSGSLEPGFFAGRMISNIPIAFCLHSAVHMASLVGERFSIIEQTDTMAQIIRHYVQLYGLSHKLVSIRTMSLPSIVAMGYIRDYPKDERLTLPDIMKYLDDAVAQCKVAIEKDRVDTLILGCPPLQCFEDEIRKRLDEAGYGEIQLISELPAAVEMAKAMVNMKLIQAPRAYPSDALKAKPEFR